MAWVAAVQDLECVGVALVHRGVLVCKARRTGRTRWWEEQCSVPRGAGLWFAEEPIDPGRSGPCCDCLSIAIFRTRPRSVCAAGGGVGQDGCAEPGSSACDSPHLKAFLQHFSNRSQLGRWNQRNEDSLVKMCSSQKCWSWVVSPRCL